MYRELLKHSERCAFLFRYLSCQLKFRFRAAERTAGGGGRAEGRKGNREASEEGTEEMPRCVRAETGALGKLKRLMGFIVINGSKPI